MRATSCASSCDSGTARVQAPAICNNTHMYTIHRDAQMCAVSNNIHVVVFKSTTSQYKSTVFISYIIHQLFLSQASQYTSTVFIYSYFHQFTTAAEQVTEARVAARLRASMQRHMLAHTRTCCRLRVRGCSEDSKRGLRLQKYLEMQASRRAWKRAHAGR